jgi:hypothetical protein
MGGLTSTPGFITVGGKPQSNNAVGKLSVVPVKYFLLVKPTYAHTVCAYVGFINMR